VGERAGMKRSKTKREAAHAGVVQVLGPMSASTVTFSPAKKSRRKDDATSAVNHPAHYGGADNPYEAIKVIEAWGLGFCLGNTVKYIAREGKKGSAIEDLRKAAWYLQREIARREKDGG